MTKLMLWSAAKRYSGTHHRETSSSRPSYAVRRPIGRATGASAGKETHGGLLPSAWGKTKEVTEI
jgi:hypothetical protein